MKRTPRIAVGFQDESGKDTAVDYLCQKFPEHARFAFADKLKEVASGVQRELGVVVEKDRVLLRLLGQELKTVYGKDVWVRPIERKIRENKEVPIFISDLRHCVELEMLKNHGFVTLCVYRTNCAYIESDEHVSINDFDYFIENNGTPEDLYKEIDEFLKEFYA